MKITKFDLLIYIINNIELYYKNENYVIYRIKYKIVEETLSINVGYLIEVDSELATDITVNVNINDYIREVRKIKLKKLKLNDNRKK